MEANNAKEAEKKFEEEAPGVEVTNGGHSIGWGPQWAVDTIEEEK